MAITQGIGQFIDELRENMPDAVINLKTRDIDDPWDRIEGAGGDLGMGGRDLDGNPTYEGSWLIKLKRGAKVEGGSFTGNSISSLGANTDIPVGQQAIELSIDPEKVGMTMWKRIRAHLKKMKGAIVVNMSQLEANLLAMPVEDIAVGNIEDAVYKIRQHKLAFAYSDGTGAVATINEVQTISDSTQTQVALTGAPYNRIVEGESYWVYSVTGWPGTTTRKGGTMICTNLQDSTGKPEFQMRTGEAPCTTAVGDLIVPEGFLTAGTSGTSLSPVGIEYMLKASGAFFSITSVAPYPKLQAFIVDASAAPIEPTPDVIAKLIDKIKRSGWAPPTMLISEPSLATRYAYLEKAGFATYVVPNRMASPDGGVGMPIFSHGTIVMPWDSSVYIRPGMLWGCTPQSFLKFQPGGSDAIHWWNRMNPGAMGGMFIPVTDGTRQTGLWHAPFHYYCENACKDPKANFLYKGLLTEETA